MKSFFCFFLRFGRGIAVNCENPLKILLTVLLCLTVSSCDKDSSNEPVLAVQTDSPDVKFSILPETVTPVSITVKSDYFLTKTLYVSSDEKAIDNIVSQIAKVGYSDYSSDKVYKSKIDSYSEVTIRGLSPATEYYIIGVAEDWYGAAQKISPKKTIKTLEFSSMVDFGEDICWSGVNYVANRTQFSPSQFNSQDLFDYYTLPDPADEKMPGNWRYPTKEELQYLCDNCTVTFIDFKSRYVRLTHNSGRHLYVPFTSYYPRQDYAYGTKSLTLFPCNDKTTGIYVRILNSSPIYDMQESVKYGNQLNNVSLEIMGSNGPNRDFFKWEYTDATVTPNVDIRGSSKRGCRFVSEK